MQDDSEAGHAGDEAPRRTAGHSWAGEPTRTIVVVPELKGADRARPSDAVRSLDARLEEAVGLARAIDVEIVGELGVRIAAPRPATLFGVGKVDEIKALVLAREAKLVVVDHALTPVQQRNLEKAWEAKVVDRTGLILEIFGARARTKEGSLQVELAHLNYQKSRLVRSWTHLERQRGGFGFLGGPGETQIEADRRLLQERITRIESELEDVRRTRTLHRKQRQKVLHPVVALVGYTNAGKSTLFNRLSHADVVAEDMLFATLDPTLRTITLPHGTDAILSDTVGFISDLPTHLVAAFRATLEEVVEADLILHVRDISHPDTGAQAADVADVLRQLDVDAGDPARVIEVWNKVDRLPDGRRDGVNGADGAGSPSHIAISALTGEGVDGLLAAIETKLLGSRPVFQLSVDPADGEGLAWLYRQGEVIERRDGEDAIGLMVRIPDQARNELARRFPAARETAQG